MATTSAWPLEEPELLEEDDVLEEELLVEEELLELELLDEDDVVLLELVDEVELEDELLGVGFSLVPPPQATSNVDAKTTQLS
jgi:hypothetical protein